MPATWPKVETDPEFTAAGATDAEVDAIRDALETSIGAKQDAASAATDDELSDAVDTLTAALAGKQSTSGLDAAVRAVIAAVFDQTPTGVLVPAFLTPRQNTTGKPIWLKTRVGGVSEPGENGHIYLETSENGTTGWGQWDGFLGVRNDSVNLAEIGVGAAIDTIVRAGHYHRYRLTTSTNYDTPEALFDGGFEFYRVLG